MADDVRSPSPVLIGQGIVPRPAGESSCLERPVMNAQSLKLPPNVSSPKEEDIGSPIPINRPSQFSQPYVLYLINATDYCMVMGRLNNGSWFSIPRICRTCSSDLNTCLSNKNYLAAFSVECNDAPFTVQLSTAPDGSGRTVTGTWHISPSCSYAGEAIGLAP